MTQEEQSMPRSSAPAGSRFLSNLGVGVFSGLIVVVVFSIATWGWQYFSEIKAIKLIGGVDREEFAEMQKRLEDLEENYREDLGELEEYLDDNIDDLFDEISEWGDDLETEDIKILDRLERLEERVLR